MNKKLSSTMPRLFGGAVVFSFLLAGCGATVALDLKTGDCLDLPDDADLQSGFEMTSVKTVSCTEAHDAQVIGQTELEGDEYPGAARIQEIANEFCLNTFESFVGTPLTESALDVFPLMPTEQSWNKADDRTLLCIAVNTTKQVTDSFEHMNQDETTQK